LSGTVRAANMVPFGNNSQFFCLQPSVAARRALPIAFAVAKPLRIGRGTCYSPSRFCAGQSGVARGQRAIFGERTTLQIVGF
jgi:hypothetical protein